MLKRQVYQRKLFSCNFRYKKTLFSCGIYFTYFSLIQSKTTRILQTFNSFIVHLQGYANNNADFILRG